MLLSPLLAVGAAGCTEPLPTQSETEDPVAVVSRAVSTTSAEYKLPASVDPDILPDQTTELWARVYRPSSLTKRYALLVFLHGNHPTCGTGSNPRVDDDCEYSITGTCPSGYVVTPNHRGYEYVANELAATNNYIVVSINANRGINCSGGPEEDPYLIKARGRLVLKHLYKLSRWSRGLEATPSSLGFNLTNRLDLGNVGLMGHSRGGGGVRAAYSLYRELGSPWQARIPDPVTFKGIFELAPFAGLPEMESINAYSTRWASLLPMCDGDVYQLNGVQPFDDMLVHQGQESPETFKATLTVWGANHNFYNSQWQQCEAEAMCVGHPALFSDTATGSASQRETGRQAMVNFFRGSVGATSSTYRRLFNPLYALPSSLTSITRVDRGYTPAMDDDRSLRLEEFQSEAPMGWYGFLNDASNITVSHQQLPEHEFTHQGGVLSWTSAGPATYWQANFASPGTGFNLSALNTLDLRVDRAADPSNPPSATDFSVSLVNADGALSSPVAIGAYISLVGPVGSGDSLHSMLQTTRIPLTRFAGATLGAIRGVRLTFDRTSSGKIYVANLRAGGSGDDAAALSALTPASASPEIGVQALTSATTPPSQRITAGNSVVAVRVAASGAQAAGVRPGGAEIELRSDVAFPAQDAPPLLFIGPAVVSRSRYVGGDLRRLVFLLSPAEWQSVEDGADLSVGYRKGGRRVWAFGRLTKPQ